MATYNLIKNSFFTSTTSSGTGNKHLTNLELQGLIDGTITSASVSLTSLDTLYLDVDLNQRVKIDGIFLYASDLTKLSNINFQYKNYKEDNYIGCDKDVSTTYTATIPEPSAPRYIRCIVTGINIDLFEFSIYNSDFVVKFGEDGMANETWISNTPIGTQGIPQVVEVYNNNINDDLSGPPINAYVCVDYTGQGKDDYIKVSKTLSGPYLGISSGTVVGYEYRGWSSGFFDNTQQSPKNGITLLDTGTKFYANRLGSMPLDTCDYINIPFGVDSAWDYAPDLHKIFAVFWQGSNSTGSSLNLYEYDLDTNVWTHRSNLAPPAPEATGMSIAYLNNFIYFRNNEEVSFFKHDLSGTLDNYTVLDLGGNGNSDPYEVIVSDRSRYIYTFAHDLNSSGGKRYFRYDTIDNSWLTISWSIAENYDHFTKKHVTFDGDRNCIYYVWFNVDGAPWVSKYHVSGNYWTQQYFNFVDRVHSSTFITIWYYNDYIYFFSPDYEFKTYRYNVVTDIVSEVVLPFKLNKDRNVFGIACPPPTGSSEEFALYCANIYKDGHGFYGYNTGFNEGTSNILISEASGTYTTNIVKMDDPFKSSYFIIDTDSVVGKTNVSKDPEVYNGTIEVRSSDIAPTPIDEIYWFVSMGTSNSLSKYTVYTGEWLPSWLSITGNFAYYVNCGTVDKRTGRLFLSTRNTSDDSIVYIYTHDGDLLYSTGHYNDHQRFTTVEPFFDKYQGVWVLVGTGFFTHYRHDLLDIRNSATIESLFAHCVELDGEGLWYTERQSNTLNRLDTDCTLQLTLNLYNPYGVCGTEDNGCWVVDLGDPTHGNCVKRFSWVGDLVDVIPTGTTSLYRITHDHKDGFYACTEKNIGKVYHYNSEGVKTMSLENLFSYNHLRAGRRGVVLFSSSLQKIVYVELASKSVIWEKTYKDDLYTGTYENCTIPDIFSWDETTQDSFGTDYGKNLIPTPYDTLWGLGTTLSWREVPKDGYFLPKNKYHQVRVTLRNYDGESSPRVNSIIMAPTEKITDILPKSSKPIYVRTEIPADVDVSLFNTRLKVWWDLEDN